MASASVIFSSFDELSQLVTWDFYTEVLGLDVDPKNLVPASMWPPRPGARNLPGIPDCLSFLSSETRPPLTSTTTQGYACGPDATGDTFLMVPLTRRWP